MFSCYFSNEPLHARSQSASGKQLELYILVATDEVTLVKPTGYKLITF